MKEFWIWTKTDKNILFFNTLTKQKLKTINENIFKNEEKYRIKKLENTKILENLDLKNLKFEKFKEKLLKTKTLNITLVLGKSCNLNCIYCFEKQENLYIEEFFNEDKFIAEIKEYIKKNNIENLNVEFYGGEPFVYYEKMLVISKKLNLIFKERFSFNIMTNGTLINKSNLNVLLNQGLAKIEISIDGHKKIHDYQRPLNNKKSSFELIFNNLTTLNKTSDLLNKIKVIIRVNVLKQTLKDLEELIVYISRLEIKNKISIYFTPVIDCSGNENLNINYKTIGEAYKIARLKGLLIPLKYYSVGPCHYHYKHSYILSNNGIYKCLTNNKSFISTSFNDIKYNEFKCPDYCNDCVYLPLCFGGCEYQNKNFKNNCPKDIFENIMPYVLETGDLDE